MYTWAEGYECHSTGHEPFQHFTYTRDHKSEGGEKARDNDGAAIAVVTIWIATRDKSSTGEHQTSGHKKLSKKETLH